LHLALPMDFQSASVVLGACTLLVWPQTIFADELHESSTPLALGFNIDLLPTALSAANGKLGYAPQVWFGESGRRLR